MLQSFAAVPGRLYVVATLLPLAAFFLLLVAGGVRNLCRPYRHGRGGAASVYWLLGGDKPLRTGGIFATLIMAVAAGLAVTGLVLFLTDTSTGAEHAARWGERADWVRIGRLATADPPEWDRTEWAKSLRSHDEEARGQVPPPPHTGLALEVGYKIDHLAALMFAMVTVISTAIFVFSLGYMKEETKEVVEDPDVPPAPRQAGHGPEASEVSPGIDEHPNPHAPHGTGHGFARRGRFGRFFLYLSLFCFSMLNLIIADNLFQVFVSWELVGVCSFFLIGFYYERASASFAANKAFIVNRVGDAGFMVGLLVAWTSLGTLNFEEMNRRVRSPLGDSHTDRLEYAHQFVRVNPSPSRQTGEPGYRLPPKDETGSHLALFPLLWKNPDHYHGLAHSERDRRDDSEHTTTWFPETKPADYLRYGAMPYWLFVVMGIGIFLGCVGKSAQVPLHTWLPDAMEGPTPVSALIHAATMVAAGVYLVGRAFPLFAPEVLLVIAYTGAITLFISATIAIAQTDIKRVLAYSTCSQLGYMMLALGVGGWVAGLFHLLTHAFFKALLFLCSGSVIHGCHHEQDLRKMGGLRSKMPITAITMLVGVLAIAGTPLFSGWYSKDMMLSAAIGFTATHREHFLLFALPAVTVGLTAFYMFRLWSLAFTGAPRDAKVHEHAHESPLVMTLPLIFLAVCSIGIAWGWPVWDAEASYLGHLLKEGQPAALTTLAQFPAEQGAAHEYHHLAGWLALALAAVGAGLAVLYFYVRQPSDYDLNRPGAAWYRFLRNKWYFDEAYDASLVEPTLGLAKLSAAVDKRSTDEKAPPGESEPPPRSFDLLTLDGWLNAIGQTAAAVGGRLRGLQTGRLRTYVLVLALTAVVLLGMLRAFAR
jgi:NADH-quinone oxidoreductase subunit L